MNLLKITFFAAIAICSSAAHLAAPFAPLASSPLLARSFPAPFPYTADPYAKPVPNIYAKYAAPYVRYGTPLVAQGQALATAPFVAKTYAAPIAPVRPYYAQPFAAAPLPVPAIARVAAPALPALAASFPVSRAVLPAPAPLSPFLPSPYARPVASRSLLPPQPLFPTQYAAPTGPIPAVARVAAPLSPFSPYAAPALPALAPSLPVARAVLPAPAPVSPLFQSPYATPVASRAVLPAQPLFPTQYASSAVPIPAVTRIAAPILPATPVLAKSPEPIDSFPQYRYGYSVNDGLTGDSKTQQESRDGDVVRGSYSLIEADGTRRIVHYYADDIHGFNAVVQKDAAVGPITPVLRAQPAPVYPVTRTLPAPLPIAPAFNPLPLAASFPQLTPAPNAFPGTPLRPVFNSATPELIPAGSFNPVLQNVPVLTGFKPVIKNVPIAPAQPEVPEIIDDEEEVGVVEEEEEEDDVSESVESGEESDEEAVGSAEEDEEETDVESEESETSSSEIGYNPESPCGRAAAAAEPEKKKKKK